MNLFKTDLLKLGTTAFDTKEGTCIICRCEGSFMETLFIREILLLFGNYQIVKEDDFQWENGECDWAVYTNLPWSEYLKLTKN